MNSHSIRFRLNLFFVFLVTATLLLSGAYNYQVARQELLSSLNAQAEGTLGRLKLSLPSALWNFDKTQIDQIIQSEMQADHVRAIIIHDENGIVAGFRRAPGGKIDVELKRVEGADPLEAALGFNDRGTVKLLGKAVLHVSDERVASSLNGLLWRFGIQLILVEALLLAGLYYGLHSALADLGAAQDRLMQIIAGSPVAAFVLDHERRVTHWNRACEKLTGFSAPMVVGSTESWRPFYDSKRSQTMADLIVSGEAGAELDKLYADKWRRSEIIDSAYEAEDFYPSFGESGRWLSFTAAPLRDSTGQVIGAIETLRDITEQRQAEAALNERAEALQRALKDLGEVIENLEQTQEELVRSEKLAALGSMVAGVAHELNTPIGNSLMVASHLVETSNKMKASLSAGLKKSMLDAFLVDTETAGDVLVRNLSKAAELVSSFKQVAVDQTSSKRRKFNLAETIAEVVISLGPRLHQSPVTLEQHIAEDIYLDSFPGPLGQVLINLINNAIIHGFDGRATGRIVVQTDCSGNGGQVVLKVSDNGIGISPEVLPRIFDPFFTTRLGQGGSGLGLNIVHNIVFGTLGGRINAESMVGEGVCFTLVLPLVAPEQATATTLFQS